MIHSSLEAKYQLLQVEDYNEDVDQTEDDSYASEELFEDDYV